MQTPGNEPSWQRAKQVQSPDKGGCSASWTSSQEARVALGGGRVQGEERTDGKGQGSWGH